MKTTNQPPPPPLPTAKPPMIEDWKPLNQRGSRLKTVLGIVTIVWLAAMVMAFAAMIIRMGGIPGVGGTDYFFWRVALFYSVVLPSIIYGIVMTCLGVTYFVTKP